MRRDGTSTYRNHGEKALDSGTEGLCGGRKMTNDAKSTLGMRQFRLFRLFGFEVKLDVSWLLLGLLISWSLGAGYFPVHYPDLPTATYAWMGISVAIGVLFSIVIHEFAHSVIARQFGMPIHGITLFIFGGVAEMGEEPPSPRAEFMMAIAGPVASFALAGTLWLVYTAAADTAPGPVLGVVEMLALINLTVAIFNLVPAFPLDGGRMFRAALWHMKRDLRTATYTSSQVGKGFGLALMILGGLFLVGGNVIGGMWWFLIGMFLRGAASASYQQTILSEMIRDRPISNFMRKTPIVLRPSTTIDELLEDYVYQYHFKLFPVVDGDTLLGSINVADVRGLPREERARRKVVEFMRPPSSDNSIPADTPTANLLPLMVQAGAPTRYMVVDGSRLVGMISLKDLLEVISLRLELDQPRNDS